MTERWTNKQREIMRVILSGVSKGSWLDIDQVMNLIIDSASKQATQCSLRILETKGVILRTYTGRRGRRRLVLEPTLKAFSLFGSGV